MKALIFASIIALTGSTASAAGGDADGSSTAPKDPVIENAGYAIHKKDWPAAQTILKEGLQKSPDNASYHNLYAYSVRKDANPDMNLVFKHYNEALRLNPKHRGAHEYIGEAYLMVGNLGKAKEHLGVLDKLCFFPCQEYTDLKKAVSQYEAKAK
jgi:hypothetical protein